MQELAPIIGQDIEKNRTQIRCNRKKNQKGMEWSDVHWVINDSIKETLEKFEDVFKKKKYIKLI